MSDELMIGNPLFVCDDNGHTILTVEGWPGEVAVIGTTGTMGPRQALQLAQALDAKARQVLKDVGVAPARPPMVNVYEGDPVDARPIIDQLSDIAIRLQRREMALLVRQWRQGNPFGDVDELFEWLEEGS
jgi:hypothetical protein